MSPTDVFLIAIRGLAGNKLRAVLTLLGVVIGVGAVISVMAIGRGSSAAITEQIESIGTNLIFVRAGASTDQGVRGAQGSAATLTLSDAEALEDPFLAPDILAVAPDITTFAQVQAGRENVNTRILGVTPAYEDVRNFPVIEGRFISDQDISARALNAVIGSNVADSLFGGISLIGQVIQINQRSFRVVGLLESKGGTGLGNEDVLILAPITTVQTRLISQRTAQGLERVQTISVQVADEDRLDAAKDQGRRDPAGPAPDHRRG